MKEFFKMIRKIFSCFLLLVIFITMTFILIEEEVYQADIIPVWSDTYSHDISPSKVIASLTCSNSKISPSGYTPVTPDNTSSTKKSKKNTEKIICGTNGVPKIEYSEDDLYWLSRIIYAEAGTEPFEGMIAVGSVVMNRVASDKYPNTVYGVIFDRKFGVQFTPAATGTVYRTPSKEAITAAKLCLCGYSISEDILFFLNERLSTSTWTKDNCRFVMTIGNHDFYA